MGREGKDMSKPPLDWGAAHWGVLAMAKICSLAGKSSRAPSPAANTALEQHLSKTSHVKMFCGLCTGWYQL